MSPNHKPLFWLHGEIKTPPFSDNARIEAGYLIRKLQKGQNISMPKSRPMPSIGARCHELRIDDYDMNVTWRIIYRIDSDAIILIDVFKKKSQQTPNSVIKTCKSRLKDYDAE